ncbi:nuclear transport factor 2 family protein [Brenneria populi subsp. brevivirga]|uniref:nuclear transport factor 2 family protein n=1 Tax=Brenneria populi TaxID=1505588 RepID=UPI002E182C6D|nr:nuclear transport factor 2 family protein [Brenneria populi subsp. brevivirga]
MIASPDHRPASIAAFFDAEYEQWVDGNRLCYNDFLHHMALLKQVTRSMSLTILAAAAQGDDVLTHHRVDVEKRDGARSAIEVFAHFTLRNQRIYRCSELTRLVDGAGDDADLGSRVSA